jgi:hypothetical protein
MPFWYKKIRGIGKKWGRFFYLLSSEVHAHVQPAKTIDVYLLFKNEFQRKMKENKLLGMNSLFNHILNKL